MYLLIYVITYEKPTSHPHPQSGWIGPIGPPRKIGKTLVILLSHGLLFGTPRQNFFGVMGYFFGPLGKIFQESWASFLDPQAIFFKSHGLLFWTPRQNFSRVMGLFFGPLGRGWGWDVGFSRTSQWKHVKSSGTKWMKNACLECTCLVNDTSTIVGPDSLTVFLQNIHL